MAAGKKAERREGAGGEREVGHEDVVRMVADRLRDYDLEDLVKFYRKNFNDYVRLDDDGETAWVKED